MSLFFGSIIVNLSFAKELQLFVEFRSYYRQAVSEVLRFFRVSLEIVKTWGFYSTVYNVLLNSFDYRLFMDCGLDAGIDSRSR